MTVKATNAFQKNLKNRKKPTTFFNPKTEPDHNRKPTFEQKNDTDPDLLPKVNPAELEYTTLFVPIT
jgi:hypothetical protein